MVRLGRLLPLFLLGAGLTLGSTGQTSVDSEVPQQEYAYGTTFFDQLRLIFGRFQDDDLQRVFQAARPIQCADLTNDKGEWRDVAFFNENRKVGNWYRKSLDEVKHDLSVYVFTGTCGGSQEHIRVTTKFPVYESFKAYLERKIPFQEIDVNVNAPVNVSFAARARAYSFDLPYLFRIENPDGPPVYTLNPRHLSDEYVTNVASRWECKAVAAVDVTYQFLICRTTLVPLGIDRDKERTQPFGSSAYSILSDGKQASSNVKLTFDGQDELPANR